MAKDSNTTSHRVAYQGVPGAYSEMATFELFKSRFPEIQVTPWGLETFEMCFDAVKTGKCDFAMIPIQNTLGGSIHGNYDLLLQKDLQIIAEYNFRVRHCLLTLPDTQMKDVYTVISHPQALAQCDDFIKNFVHQATAKSEFDTAGSAKLLVDKNLKDHAAIASELAAQHYKLKIVRKGIEDEDSNFTRFLLLTSNNRKLLSLGPMKTTLVFSLKNGPGALFKHLAAFALRDIDLTKLESRPAKNLHRLVAAKDIEADPSVFRYLFYCDLLGSREDVPVKNAIRHLEEMTPFVKVLGTYAACGISTAVMQKIDKRNRHAKCAKEVENRLTIGIVGFGTFGQFLAKTWIKRGHTVVATSRTDYTTTAHELGVTSFHRSLKDFFYTYPKLDVIVLCMSILSFEKVVNKIPWDILDDSCVMDVLSVKSHPRQVLKAIVPNQLDIICSHPMFGPQSGKDGWQGLPFVYEEVRISNRPRCEKILDLFKAEGCNMISMQCDIHDSYAAKSQFITHFTGRILGRLGIKSTPINTKGFESLLQLRENTVSDSMDLFHALYKYNESASSQLKEFQDSMHYVRGQLEGISPNSSSIFSSRITNSKPSGTGAVIARISELRSEGVEVIGLNVGEPCLPPADCILEGAVNAVKSGKTRYVATNGLKELRELICKKLEAENGLRYSSNQIVVGNGAKQPIFQAVMALAGLHDEVIIPVPFWTSYEGITTLANATPVYLSTQAKNCYKVTPHELRKCLNSHPAAKLFFLCNPGNPTGSIYSDSELRTLAKVFEDYPRVFIIADEIYEKINFTSAPITCFATLPNMYERTITINGFSKGYCMTGFRQGYAACPTVKCAKALGLIQGHNTTCTAPPNQWAAIAALRNPEPVKRRCKEMVDLMHRNRDLCVSKLSEIEKLSFVSPDGAFYIMLDVSGIIPRAEAGTKFCEQLLEVHKVALVPGVAFGVPQCVRLCFSTETKILEEALQRIANFCRSSVI